LGESSRFRIGRRADERLLALKEDPRIPRSKQGYTGIFDDYKSLKM